MSNYDNVVLTDSPIRYYKLGDTGTTAVDSGSQGVNGTLSAGVSTGQSAIVTDGSTSMAFNGTSTALISAATTGLPTGASAWSLEAWCVPSTTDYETVVSMGTLNSNQLVSLYYRSSGAWQVWSFSTAIVSFTPTTASKYHLVVTYDGTTATLYINGAFAASNPYTFNLIAGIFYLGNDNQGDYQGGRLHKVAVYSSALNLTRVQAHYNAGINATPPSTSLPRLGNHRSFARMRP